MRVVGERIEHQRMPHKKFVLELLYDGASQFRPTAPMDVPQRIARDDIRGAPQILHRARRWPRAPRRLPDISSFPATRWAAANIVLAGSTPFAARAHGRTNETVQTDPSVPSSRCGNAKPPRRNGINSIRTSPSLSGRQWRGSGFFQSRQFEMAAATTLFPLEKNACVDSRQAEPFSIPQMTGAGR